MKPYYYWTNKEFKSFDKEPKPDFGYWFTDDIDLAKMFGKNIIKAELTVETPFQVEDETCSRIMIDFLEKTGQSGTNAFFTKEFREYIQAEGFDSMNWESGKADVIVAFDLSQIKELEVVISETTRSEKSQIRLLYEDDNISIAEDVINSKYCIKNLLDEDIEVYNLYMERPLEISAGDLIILEDLETINLIREEYKLFHSEDREYER